MTKTHSALRIQLQAFLGSDTDTDWTEALLKCWSPLFAIGESGFALATKEHILSQDDELKDAIWNVYRQRLPVRRVSLDYLRTLGGDWSRARANLQNVCVLHDHDPRPNMARNPNRALEVGIEDDPLEMAIIAAIIGPMRERFFASYGFLEEFKNPDRCGFPLGTTLLKSLWHPIGLSLEFAKRRNERGLDDIETLLGFMRRYFLVGRSEGEKEWIVLTA